MRTVIIAAFQVLVSIVALVLLLRQVSLRQVLEVQREFPIVLIILSTMVFAISFLIATYNWHFILLHLEAHIPFRSILSANLSGLFYGSVLPSAFSSDMVRGVRLYKDGRRASLLATSIFVDRLTGLLTFILIFVIASPSYYRYLPQEFTKLINDYSIYLLGFVSLIALVFMLIVRVYFWDVLDEKFQRSKIGGQTIVVAVLITSLSHIFYAGVLWIFVSPFSTQPNFFYCLFITEVLVIAEFLPISVGGLGVRESLYLIMLEPIGVGSTEAVAIALLQFFVILFVSLVGGVQEVMRLLLALWRNRINATNLVDRA